MSVCLSVCIRFCCWNIFYQQEHVNILWTSLLKFYSVKEISNFTNRMSWVAHDFREKFLKPVVKIACTCNRVRFDMLTLFFQWHFQNTFFSIFNMIYKSSKCLEQWWPLFLALSQYCGDTLRFRRTWKPSFIQKYDWISSSGIQYLGNWIFFHVNLYFLTAKETLFEFFYLQFFFHFEENILNTCSTSSFHIPQLQFT